MILIRWQNKAFSIRFHILTNYTANYTYAQVAEGEGKSSIIQFNGIIFKSVKHASSPRGQMCVKKSKREEA